MSSPRTPGRRAWWIIGPALVALVTTALPAPPVGAASSSWSKPVSGAVVRPYREPPARFASGHRGVDFAAPAGTPVRAVGSGTVTFAGTVAGALHVVVAHPGGIRTSYSYLARVDVPVGATVSRGAVLGMAGGAGSSHGRGLLHLGARAGSRYFDPMLLFGPTDLTKLVRLVPADGPAISDEQVLWYLVADEADDGSCAGGIPIIEEVCDAAELVGGIAADAGAWTWDRVEEAVDVGLALLRAAGEAAALLADQLESLVRDVLRTIRDAVNGVVGAAARLAEAIASGAVEVFNAVVAAGLELIERLTSCPQPPALVNPRGSGNVVLAVGGLGSSSRRAGRRGSTPSFGFRSEALGYDRDDVGFFSYAPDSPAYSREDTFGDLHVKAQMLGEQIKDFARAHPGRSIDLVGHSQGGVVIDLFLTDVYRGHEHEYPPIENVVTFASPHQGTPLADLERAIDQHVYLGPIAREAAPGLPLGAVSVAQLAEDSSTMEELWADGGVPRTVRFLSIVGAEDAVVPSPSSDVPGGTKIVVPVGSTLVPDDHRGVLSDDDAISAAQSHLAGGSPADSCGPFTDLGGKLYSDLVRFATDKLSGPLPPSDPPSSPPPPARVRRLVVPARGARDGGRYTDRSTRAPVRDLSRSQQLPGRHRLRAAAQAGGRTT